MQQVSTGVFNICGQLLAHALSLCSPHIQTRTPPLATHNRCGDTSPRRLCKLSPEVQHTLDDNDIKLVATFPAPPKFTSERAGTLFIMLRVENDMWIVACGGGEGANPGKDEESIQKFAREVRGEGGRVLHDVCCARLVRCMHA